GSCLRAGGDECGLIGGECGLAGSSVGTQCKPKTALVCGFGYHCLRAATASHIRHGNFGEGCLLTLVANSPGQPGIAGGMWPILFAPVERHSYTSPASTLSLTCEIVYT